MAISNEYLRVISASRRIDLAGAYPDRFIELLRSKAPPQKTHTLVIWTKNPLNLLNHLELRNEILKYESIFLHLTITGMGGSIFEPNTPKPEIILSELKSIVSFARGPAHVRLRFDPIVHIRMKDDSQYTNLPNYTSIARAASIADILNVSISWMQVYQKVSRNLKSKGMMPVVVSNAQFSEELSFLQRISNENGITLHSCCIPSMPVSRCIDGFLLGKIHPRKLLCSIAKAKGQRELCGCTESLDIGWYELCRHGCIYCYANPLIE
jgi:hypothetical protein